MKKLFSLILCALILCCAAAPAMADVIWEPYVDDFYVSHIEECEYVNGTYLVNSVDGYLPVYESPQSGTQTAVFANGVEIYVGFTWTDESGKIWGVVVFETGPDNSATSVWYNGETGWVEMAQLTRLYDENQFWTDHEDEFVYYDEPQTISLLEAPILLWTYPGSGEAPATIDPELWGWTPDSDPAYSMSWTGADGKTWAYIGYYYSQSGWVCLSDPANENLPAAVPTPAATLIPATTPPASSGVFSGSVILVIALVVVVVIVTVVIITTLNRKKDAAPEQSESQDEPGEDKKDPGSET